MRYTTANIQALPPMTRNEVYGDVRKVALQSDVIGWQEIHLPVYVDEVQNLRGFEHRWLNTASTPISVRSRRAHIIGQSIKHIHAPVTGITRSKHVTAVKLARTGNPRKQWVCTDRHTVNAIFSTPQRKQMWEDGNKIDREFVADFVRQGLPVMGMGDYNRKDFPVMGDTIATKKVRYAVRSGIDYVWFIDGDDYKWDVDEHQTISLNSDHNAHMVRAQLRKT